MRKASARTFVVFGLYLTLTVQGLAQQTPILNHYYYNPYLINPAAAGQSKETRAFLLYRQQWIGIPDAPQTQAFTIDGLLDERPIGLGINITNDVSNIIGRLSAMLSGSYTVKLATDHELGFGMSLGILRNELKFDKIRADVTDPGLLQNNENNTTLEGNAGLRYRYHKFSLGFVSEQLFNRRIAYKNSADFREVSFELVRHYLLSFQYDLQLNPDLEFTPLVVLRNAQGLPLQADVNALFKYRSNVWTNLSYRHKAGVGLALGANVGDRFIVGYNYEIPTTDLRQTTSGSHEVMIGIRFIHRSGKPVSTRAAHAKVMDEVKKSTNAQYEKLDELHQKNETLNQQLAEYKKVIEQQNSEIDQLKKSISSFDSELKTTIEQLKVDLQREQSFDKSSNYYLVIGSFKTLAEAKTFQRIVRRETSLKPEVIQSESQTWYFVYSDTLQSPGEARTRIEELESTSIKPYIVGNPWVYKTRKK
jgi:type IX secretion system PorP/SprF family membrane protein